MARHTGGRLSIGPGDSPTRGVRPARGGDSPTRGVQNAVSRQGPRLSTVGTVSVTGTTVPPPQPAVPSPAGTGPGPAILLRTWLWGWLAIAHFLTGLLLSGFYLTVAVLLVVGLAIIPAFGAGLPIVVISLLLALLLGAFERTRIEAFTGVRIGSPPPPRADRPAWRRYLLDGRPWRAGGYVTMIAVWHLMIGLVTIVLLSVCGALMALPLYRDALPDGRLALWDSVALTASGWLVPVGWAGLVVLPPVARGLVTVDVHLARWLLGPSQHEQVVALSERVETLTLTREAAVDSAELERRRIERDLHDGPQQRLVSIAMDLGMAREKLGRGPEDVRELVDKAHAGAKEAIVEMRQVARGIHPPVLTDRGLDAALSALAARSPVPVSVHVHALPRPPATVEAIAYFCVSEALTNVAKHAEARSASVEVVRRGDQVTITVRDDGRGGADPTRGSGLVGLRDRVAAVDGTLAVSSPPGGPTVLSVVLPTQLHPFVTGSTR